MRLVPRVLALAIATALAASMGATAQSPDPSETPAELTLMPEALQGSAWRLVSIGDRVVPSERELNLFLRGSDGNGTASGRSACRSYRTTFEADGDTVGFDAPTLGGAGDCADSLLELDGAYLDALTSTTEWRLEEGTLSGPVLHLSGTVGGPELIFQPSDSPSTVAPCPVMADAEVSVPAEPDVDEAGDLVVMEPTLELCPPPHQSFRTIIDAGVGRVRAKSIPRLSDWDRATSRTAARPARACPACRATPCGLAGPACDPSANSDASSFWLRRGTDTSSSPSRRQPNLRTRLHPDLPVRSQGVRSEAAEAVRACTARL